MNPTTAGQHAASSPSNTPFTGTDPAASSTRDSGDSAVAALLIWGLVVTALIGAPYQVVVPDTLKAVVASIFAMACLVLWVFRLDLKSTVRWSPYLIAPFGLALTALTSLAWNPAGPALTSVARWLVIGILVAVGLNAFGRDSLKTLARAAHWSAFFLSLLALAEFWFELSIFPTEAPPGATFGNRNFYAEFVAVTLPFSLWLLLRPKSVIHAALMGCSFGLILVGLMSTGTRAALVSAPLSILFVVALGILGAARARNIRPDAMAVTAGFASSVLMVLALGWLPSSNAVLIKEGRGVTPIERTSNRLASLAEKDTYAPGSSFGIRMAAWETGRQMIAAHPLRGIGPGNWNAMSPLYSPVTEEVETVWFAHNEVLQLIAEYGLAGWAALLMLAGLIATTVREVGIQLYRRHQVEHALQRGVALGSLAAFAVVSLSGLPLHASTTCYLLALVIGYLLASRPGREVTVAAVMPLRIGRYAAIAALGATIIVSVQGLRSSFLVQRGGGLLAGLVEQPSLPKNQVAQIRSEAVDHLRRGFGIYSDHGLAAGRATSMLLQVEDPANALLLGRLALRGRPHVAAVKCNIARAYAELGNFPEADRVLKEVEDTRPAAVCLMTARIDYQFKQGRFGEVLALGKAAIAGITATTDPKVARYLVDTTYRAAIRVPDVDAAIDVMVLRAERWPELRAQSWLLVGQLLAAKAPGQVSEQAVVAFKNALHFSNAQERPQIQARVPASYQSAVK